MTFANNIYRDQAPRNVGSDLQSILFDSRINFAGNCLYYMHECSLEDIEVLSFLENFP